MYFSTILALFAATALCSAIPTHPRHGHLFPRQTNGTCPGNKAPISSIDAEAAAEAHQFDATATFAARSVSIKTSDGDCLSVRPECGDFRHNLIPLEAITCDGVDEKQKFDIITKGKHITQDEGMLVVSTSTLGCLNLDSRRDDVNMFSCGGRAGGEGDETLAQIFSFIKAGTSSALKLQNDNETCLAVASGKLVSAGCSGEASQNFALS
ncbi:MAG: hypothetical protein Q9180_006714 [Flavoplaca navasiana]